MAELVDLELIPSLHHRVFTRRLLVVVLIVHHVWRQIVMPLA